MPKLQTVHNAMDYCYETCQRLLPALQQTCFKGCLKSLDYFAQSEKPQPPSVPEIISISNDIGIETASSTSEISTNSISTSEKVTKIITSPSSPFLLAGGTISLTFFTKSLFDTRLTTFLLDIGIANAGAMLALYPLTDSLKLTSLVVLAVTGAAVALRLKKGHAPNPVPIHSKRPYHHPKLKQPDEQPSEPQSVSLDTSPCSEKVKKLSSKQEEVLDQIIEVEARLDKQLDINVVRQSLDKLIETIMTDPENPAEFEKLTEKVIELVHPRCAECHNGNTFTGGSYSKTLGKCKVCFTPICSSGPCQQEHWKAVH